jgi:hypothetical protein
MRTEIPGRTLVAALAAPVLLASANAAAAQTDYLNLDRGRPVTIEDAHPVERFALELQLAPVRLERRAGLYDWQLEPELAYGLLPGVQVGVGVPLHVVDGAAARETGLAGLELGALYNLNTETLGLPAFALAADVLLPVGRFAPERAYASVTGIATRTLGRSRLHVNGSYTFGRAGRPPGGPPPAGGPHVARWLAGAAIDRAFPLRAVLGVGELHAARPLHGDEPVEWTAGGGIRAQLDPRVALDAGLSRRMTGRAPAWSLTFGAAWTIGLPALMPRGGR